MAGCHPNLANWSQKWGSLLKYNVSTIMPLGQN
jgi:hypothetical protein